MLRLLFGILLAPNAALAHGGNPAEARVTGPMNVGTVADAEFTVTWIDSDTPIPTGTATVDLHYTETMPPTYFLGDIPDSLSGTPIVEGIRETDTANRFTWDTSSVPSGTYWIWSRVDEPPEPIPSPVYISFSPAPLHVQHPGDPIGPSVRVTRPNTDISYSDEGFEIRWQAFAPNGPATIRLEAGLSLDGTDFTVIADGLAATSTGAFYWETAELAEGDWTIRAVITDETGSFTAYCPYFLLITHFFPLRDSGVRDAAPPPDAGRIDAASATDTGGEPPPPEEGCNCTATRAGASNALWLAIALAGTRRRRSRGSP
jgi:MYXO-CTERM domain-containing protein